MVCSSSGKNFKFFLFQALPLWAFESFRGLSLGQKVVVFSVTLGTSVLWILTKYFKRKRRPLTSRSLRGATRRARQMSINSNKSDNAGSKKHNTTYDWIDLQRRAASCRDTESVTSIATLVDGTPLTPQQLGKFELKHI